jgi:hypothetical protein
VTPIYRVSQRYNSSSSSLRWESEAARGLLAAMENYYRFETQTRGESIQML